MKPLGIIMIVAALILAFIGGMRVEHSRFPQVTEKTDTTYVHDTIEVDRPVAKDSVVYRYITEYLPVHDTTFLHDSVLVDVPIERKIYEKDSVYYAVVSGFRPSLDTLRVFRETVMIETTRTITAYKPHKWRVGAFLSQEVGLDHYQAKVGVEGDFGFKNDRWRFVPEAGYRWTSLNDGGWYAGGKIKYDMIRKK